MGKDCGKQNENIYFRCRKEAAIWDDRLCSRESTADLLGVSVSSLADYELGITKVVPVDKVVLMADLYKSPQLKTTYCKNDCPIGECLTVATEILGIETIVIKLLNSLEEGKIKEVKMQLIQIAATGGITEENYHSIDDILTYLDGLAKSISELKLLGTKTKAMMESL